MNRQAGLTIIEVLVAITILGIIMAALAYMQISTIRMTGDSAQDSEAMQTAIQVLDSKISKMLLDSTTFENYSKCPMTTAVACTTSLADVSGTVTIDGSDKGYQAKGLIEVMVRITSPGKASVSYFVSCMDLHPVPTVAEPYPCPSFGELQ